MVFLLGSGVVLMSLLIGCDGVICWVVFGECCWDEVLVRDWVKELFV